MRGSQKASGQIDFTGATADQAITLGFRPSRIRITAVCDTGADDTALAFLTWEHGGGVGVGVSSIPNGTSESYNTAKLAEDASNHVVLSISTVTDTGFTIVITQTGSVTDASLIWEAEGEL